MLRTITASGVRDDGVARRGRRWVAVRLVVVAVGMSGAGIVWYARPVRLIRLLGIDYRAVVHRGRCHTTWRGRSCTSLPVLGPGRPTPAVLAALDDQAFFDVNPWTRGVRTAYHTRIIEDSLRWRAALDSARRAVAEQRLDPLPCDTSVLHFPSAAAWRVGAREVQLFSGWAGRPRPRVRGRAAHGYLLMRLVPYGSPGCGRDVPERHYRLLTPDEMARRGMDWLTHSGHE